MTRPLHLVRMPIDAGRLYAFARRSRLAARDFDDGYAVHALLAALFDHGSSDGARLAPKPFAIDSSIPDPARRGQSARSLDVLGYCTLDHRALAERARAFADPLAWGVCDLDAMGSRPMPEAFAPGTRLGFTLRACCVRRVAKRGNQRADRAEVDAFLAKAWEAGDRSVELEREQVYRGWLEQEIAKESASKLLRASMVSWRLARLHRRSQGAERRGSRVQHPDVTFDGVLEVVDPSAFATRLARGVGRHRSFGFGMLLLKPPTRG
ncbi:MAG: type I-E CRISPR-associated protein Cas6/Cse3/CasE [Deltaproteobacteria bacterium]|nr:type I-E CRISPR-associated protein Cas6/Cse3/CasE [Deltaproteobacteria bacterium]